MLTGRVILFNAKIDGSLNIEKSTVAGPIDMSGIQVGGNIKIRRTVVLILPETPNSIFNATDQDKLDLSFAEIRNNLEIWDALLPSQLDLTGTQLRGEFNLGQSDILPRLSPRWQKGAKLTLQRHLWLTS